MREITKQYYIPWQIESVVQLLANAETKYKVKTSGKGVVYYEDNDAYAKYYQ